MKHRNLPPVIGIVGYRNCDSGTYALRQTYVDSVLRAGGLPVVLPLLTDEAAVKGLLKRIDGLLLSGGGDVDPAVYGAERRSECGEADELRDQSELLFIRLARARRMPIFGICRGAQILNAAYGGTLIQDIPSQLDIPGDRHCQPEPYNTLVHDVQLTKDGLLSRVTGRSHFMTNSMHHQAIDKAGGSLVIDAVCGDGIVEAVYDSEDETVFGVQFHPEFFSGEQDYAQKLFDYFADRAEAYARDRKE